MLRQDSVVPCASNPLCEEPVFHCYQYTEFRKMLPPSFGFNWLLEHPFLNLGLVWFCTGQQTPSMTARLKSELSSGHHQSPHSLGSWQTSLVAFLVLLPPLPGLSDSLFSPSFSWNDEAVVTCGAGQHLRQKGCLSSCCEDMGP